MKNKTLDCVAYLRRQAIGHYAESQLIGLVYLADWRASLTLKKPITDIRWSVEKVRGEEKLKALIRVEGKFEGITKYLTNWKPPGVLNPQEISVLDYVWKQAGRLSMNELFQLIESTYPIIASNVGEEIDLIKYGKIYKEHARPLLIGSEEPPSLNTSEV